MGAFLFAVLWLAGIFLVFLLLVSFTGCAAGSPLAKQLELLKDEKALSVLETKLRKGWITEEEFADVVQRLFRSKMKSLGLDPDGELPLYSIPTDFGDPEIGMLVGYPVHDGQLMSGLYMPIEELTKCHVGAWGISTAGKTTEMCYLLSQVAQAEEDRLFICYDTQGGLGSLIANFLPPERILEININEYWKNPLQDLYEHGVDAAVGSFKSSMVIAAYIGDATSNIWSKQTRKRCTAEKVLALGPPSLGEMLFNAKNLEETKGKAFSRKVYEYQQSLLNILDNLSRNLSAVYSRPISKGFFFADLEGVVVVNLAPLRDPASLHFFIAKELHELALYAQNSSRPVTVFLDETHRFAPLEKQYGNFTKPILIDLVKTSLKLDLNFWFMEQNPGQMVHPAIFANTSTQIAFRLPSRKDRLPVLYSMNITRKDQEEAVGTFERQECLIYSNSLGEAVLVKTPDLEISDHSTEVNSRSATRIKAFHERFLRESGHEQQSVESGHKPVNLEPTVQEKTKRIMAQHRADYPLTGITETYSAVGVSPEIGRKHLDEMLELGWLEGPERMPASAQSNKSKDCYVVTEAGCKALGLDWKKARLPGKGSLKSRLAGRMIGDFLAAQGKAVHYEHVLSTGSLDKAADVAVLEPNGKIMAYEYENTPANAVSNVEKNRQAGFCQTVVVCPTKAVLKKVQRSIESKVEADLFHEVVFKVLREFAS